MTMMMMIMTVVVLPAAGAMPVPQVVAPYADQMVFLFLGGLVLAKAVEKSNAPGGSPSAY